MVRYHNNEHKHFCTRAILLNLFSGFKLRAENIRCHLWRDNCTVSTMSNTIHNVKYLNNTTMHFKSNFLQLSISNKENDVKKCKFTILQKFLSYNCDV